jgi:enoyl-CoA hydratase
MMETITTGISTKIYNPDNMKFENIVATLENGVLTITINRPEKLNALNRQTLTELKVLIEDVYHNAEIRGVILTGSGVKSFVAGADISEFANYGISQAKHMSAFGHEIFNMIENSPKPIIAAVNGFALGGGCELAMACHIRIAADNAKFGQPEVNLGIIPGYAGTQRLTQLIGKGKSLELLMTGDMIGAEEALNLGLVNHVVKQEELFAKANEILNKITAKSPVAVEGVIKCVNAYYTDGTNGSQFEIDIFSHCFGKDDFKEGTIAFLEKRKPAFKGL